MEVPATLLARFKDGAPMASVTLEKRVYTSVEYIRESDSLIALVNGKFVVLRVPDPPGFFAKGMDRRID